MVTMAMAMAKHGGGKSGPNFVVVVDKCRVLGWESVFIDVQKNKKINVRALNRTLQHYFAGGTCVLNMVVAMGRYRVWEI